MQTWIALFRGINVGGNNILPMAKLREDLESLKLRNVRTYIQSGNVVFEAPAGKPAPLAQKIARRIEDQHGFHPQVILLDRESLLAAVKANPFPKATADPKTLHFFFLAEPAADPDMAAIASAGKATEEYKLMNGVFYLHAPDGIARSKLAANAEKYLGVVATARNYRTVDKLRTMAVDT